MQVPQANWLLRCNHPQFEAPPCPVVGTMDEINEHARQFHSNNVQYAGAADHYDRKKYHDKKESARGNRNQGGGHQRAPYRHNRETRHHQPGPSWQNNQVPPRQGHRQRRFDIDERGQAQPPHNPYAAYGWNQKKEQHQGWNGAQHGQHQGHLGQYPGYPGQGPAPGQRPAPVWDSVPGQGPTPRHAPVPGQSSVPVWSSAPGQGPVPGQAPVPAWNTAPSQRPPSGQGPPPGQGPLPGHYPQQHPYHGHFPPPQAAYPGHFPSYPPGPPDHSHHYPAQYAPGLIMPPPPASPPQFHDEVIPAAHAGTGQNLPPANLALHYEQSLMAAARASVSLVNMLKSANHPTVVHQAELAVPYRASRPSSPLAPEVLRRDPRWQQHPEPPPAQPSPGELSNSATSPAASPQNDTPPPSTRPDVFLRLASMTKSSNPMEALASSGGVLSNQENLEQEEEEEEEDESDEDGPVVLTMTEQRRIEEQAAAQANAEAPAPYQPDQAPYRHPSQPVQQPEEIRRERRASNATEACLDQTPGLEQQRPQDTRQNCVSAHEERGGALSPEPRHEDPYDGQDRRAARTVQEDGEDEYEDSPRSPAPADEQEDEEDVVDTRRAHLPSQSPDHLDEERQDGHIPSPEDLYSSEQPHSSRTPAAPRRSSRHPGPSQDSLQLSTSSLQLTPQEALRRALNRPRVESPAPESPEYPESSGSPPYSPAKDAVVDGEDEFGENGSPRYDPLATAAEDGQEEDYVIIRDSPQHSPRAPTTSSAEAVQKDGEDEYEDSGPLQYDGQQLAPAEEQEDEEDECEATDSPQYNPRSPAPPAEQEDEVPASSLSLGEVVQLMDGNRQGETPSENDDDEDDLLLISTSPVYSDEGGSPAYSDSPRNSSGSETPPNDVQDQPAQIAHRYPDELVNMPSTSSENGRQSRPSTSGTSQYSQDQPAAPMSSGYPEDSKTPRQSVPAHLPLNVTTSSSARNQAPGYAFDLRPVADLSAPYKTVTAPPPPAPPSILNPFDENGQLKAVRIRSIVDIPSERNWMPRSRPVTPCHSRPTTPGARSEYSRPGSPQFWSQQSRQDYRNTGGSSRPATPCYGAPGRQTPGYSTPGRYEDGSRTPGHGFDGSRTPGRATPGAYGNQGRQDGRHRFDRQAAYHQPGRHTPGGYSTPGHYEDGSHTPGSYGHQRRFDQGRQYGTPGYGGQTPGGSTTPGRYDDRPRTPGSYGRQGGFDQRRQYGHQASTPGTPGYGNGGQTPGGYDDRPRTPGHATPGSYQGSSSYGNQGRQDDRHRFDRQAAYQRQASMPSQPAPVAHRMAHNSAPSTEELKRRSTGMVVPEAPPVKKAAPRNRDKNDVLGNILGGGFDSPAKKKTTEVVPLKFGDRTQTEIRRPTPKTSRKK